MRFGSLYHKLALTFSKPFFLSGQDYKHTSYRSFISIETGQQVSWHGNWMGVAKAPEVSESRRKSFYSDDEVNNKLTAGSLTTISLPTVVPWAWACYSPLIPALGKL